MSFLSKLSALKKNTPVKHTPVIPDKESNPVQEVESLLPANYVRDEDPAVKRLKELRRKERIKNGELLKKRNATAKRQSGNGDSHRNKKNKLQKDEDGGMLGTVYKKKIGSSIRANYNDSNKVIKPRVPIKKMSFEELMRQADQNGKLPMKSTSEPPTIGQSKKLIKPGFKRKSTRVSSLNSNESLRGDRHREDNQASGSKEVSISFNRSKSVSNTKKDNINNDSSSSGGDNKNIVKISSISANRFAQPNAKIKQRLERKGYKVQSRHDRFGRHYNGRSDNYDEDEDIDSGLDDFIEDASDEEESRYSARSRNPGYNRDEIWAMFNRGKNRPHYYSDYDDENEDDMEANEMEILEEEEYATRMARLEDKKEEEWLRRHEEEKRRLKKKYK